ncbi:hypothetical protein ACEU2D_14365 [Brevibacillus laterosporus]|uniref:hypothetical protein n=1 Tax=Brevibacillus laterosporus TaxID=1465 RepID=UPI0035A58452
MKSNIFIPKKIKVGFQNRDNTYTKKLAYVIYYDQKDKLRKEISWNCWRDKNIQDVDFINEPTSGFVLNKKVGDYVSDWNHRQAYVRVYDPRDFEFEITIENLLYILENANSIKGKGLEGDFIYGWDGKELVLIPTSSPDYLEISSFNKLVHNQKKLKGKDLKIGGTYLTNENKEWIYLGRFDKWKTDYDNKFVNEHGYTIYPSITKGKAYFFKRESEYGDGIESIKSLTKIISMVSEECVENYAELMDVLQHNSYYSPIDHDKDEYVPYTKEELEKTFKNRDWKYVYTENRKRIDLNKRNSDTGIFFYYQIQNPNYQPYRWGINGNEEPYYLNVSFKDLDEVIEQLNPCYLRKYLANGNLYSEGK